jgi:hypothetical protein
MRVIAVSVLSTVILAVSFTQSAAGAQHVSDGVARIGALANENLDIDGVDDERVDVDVAVIDSGIDLDHPDLDVVGGVDCLGATAPAYECDDSPGAGDDDHGHGTNSAGVVGGLDNDRDGVGVAPGARLWAVRVLPASLFAEYQAGGSPTMDEDALIGAVKWVTAHADEIEIATMSLACFPGASPPANRPVCPGAGPDLEDAIEESVDAGIVYVAAAGNWNVDVADIVPGSFDDVITVGGLADFDGQPGGLRGDAWCGPDPEPVAGVDDDDTFANALNHGAGVRLLAPATCIGIHLPASMGTSYFVPEGVSGGGATSVATPHVAGAAALLASADNPESRADVEAIGDAIYAAADDEQTWTDDASDHLTVTDRRLVDVGDESVFDPEMDTRPLDDEVLQLGAFSPAPGVVDLFAQSTSNALKHKRLADGAWSDWEEIPGGTVLSAPDVVSQYAGVTDVYARGIGGIVQTWHHESTGWSSPWGWHGGSFASGPTAVSRFPGLTDLYARGTDDALYSRWHTSAAGWSSWASMGGTVTSSPDAVSATSGDVDLFARDSANRVSHLRWNDEEESWSSWTPLGPGAIASAPDAASNGPGHVAVFVISQSGSDMWHVASDDSETWSTPQSLGGQWIGEPAATSSRPGELDAFAIDQNHDVWHKHHDGSTWHDWQRVRW